MSDISKQQAPQPERPVLSSSRVRYVTQAGVIAAVYAALTFLAIQFLQALAWGPVQLRVSEAATVLALFTPAAIPGLTIGSVLANLSSPLGPVDVVLGSAGTLLGALWTWRFRRNKAFALLGPVISNALIVPAYLPLLLKDLSVFDFAPLGLHAGGSWLSLYVFGVIAVGTGQALVLYTLGWALHSALARLGLAGVLERE